MKQRIVSLICLLLAAALVLTVAGCNKEATKKITSPDAGQTSETSPEPEAQARTGGGFDEIIFTVIPEDEAVLKITAGDADIYAGPLSGSANFQAINDAGIQYSVVGSKYYEILLNPVDTTGRSKELNPFASSKIREAMNWLIDRAYVCQEIFGGTAAPKYVPQSQNSPDYSRYIQYMRQVEAQYAYNNEKAINTINAQMEALGAHKNSDGVWTFMDSPVVITALIRNDDSALNQIGDYVCNELVRIGFTVDRKYKSRMNCFSIWSETNPAENEWNLYTGAWSADPMMRDSGAEFRFYYSPASEYGYTALYKAYNIDGEFSQACENLANRNYQTPEQRQALFERVLQDINSYSFRVWVCQSNSYIPRSTELLTSSGVAGGVALNPLTPFTIRSKDQAGGSMVWANSALFDKPVNPVGGSDSEYDRQYQIFTQDYAILPDPYTGLGYKQRIQSAEVTVQTGLPVTRTKDWVNLKFQDEIAVPADAMVDWDASGQTWVTAGQEYLNSLVAHAAAQLATVEADRRAKPEEIQAAEAYLDEMQAIADRGYLTARRKSVVTYPKSLNSLLWHDGTGMSAADFMMRMIVLFDTGSESSPYYDSSMAKALESFRESFKGWKIISTDPLKIEFYSDAYALDAEANVEDFWPDYGFGQSNWADMAVSLQAVASGGAAFSQQSAGYTGGYWLDWLSGPSLQVMEDALVELIEEESIPYEPVMRQYVTAEQAAKAYDNILNFYSEYGHFYIGCGPYYIGAVDKSAMTLTLRNFDRYMDRADKWAEFTEPVSMVLKMDGPLEVAAGQDAVFIVDVSQDGEGGAYPQHGIESVKYILYDSGGLVVWHGAGEFAQAGQYRVALSWDNISALTGGTCRLEVSVLAHSNAAADSVELEFSVK